MNQDLFPNVSKNHPLFKEWMSNELPYGMYDFTKDLTLVVHQQLTNERSILKNYLGTILDLKHRVGKEQTIYRLQNQEGKLICLICHSETPFAQTIIPLPEGTVIESVYYIMKELIR